MRRVEYHTGTNKRSVFLYVKPLREIDACLESGTDVFFNYTPATERNETQVETDEGTNPNPYNLKTNRTVIQYFMVSSVIHCATTTTAIIVISSRHRTSGRTKMISMQELTHE